MTMKDVHTKSAILWLDPRARQGVNEAAIGMVSQAHIPFEIYQSEDEDSCVPLLLWNKRGMSPSSGLDEIYADLRLAGYHVDDLVARYDPRYGWFCNDGNLEYFDLPKITSRKRAIISL